MNNFLPDPICEIDNVFCGCGDPDLAWKWISDYLMMLLRREAVEDVTIDPFEFKPESATEYIAVYLFDHFKLTEHGTSIRVPWITSKGLIVLGFLLRNGYDWFDREWIDVDGIHRGTFDYEKDLHNGQ